MPTCRNCHAQITRFDKDICPFCGTKDPLKGVTSETIEITSYISPVEDEEVKDIIKMKKRWVASLLAMILGVFSAHYFYLGYLKRGLVNLIASIVIVALVGSLLFFLDNYFKSNFLAYIIPLAGLYLINIIEGISIIFNKDMKDKRGLFLS